MRSKIIASSLIRAMLRSRCVFSMTLAASATRMLLARWVPGGDDAGVERVDVGGGPVVEPEVTFTDVGQRCSGRPG
jgi:hypothetical protein